MPDEQTSPTAVQWKILNKKHDCYRPERVAHMRLLYKGGYDIREHADQFLTPMMGESDSAYQERLSVSAYVPLVPKFVDTYTSNLFSEDLFVHEAQDADDVNTLGGEGKSQDFYKLFASDCDGLGTSFHSFIKEVYRTAQIEEYGWFGQDLPKQDGLLPTNLLEEELRGQDRNILYKIDQLNVWDYHVGADGKLDWIKLGWCIKDAPSFDSPEMHHYLIKVLTRVPGANMQWAEYVTKQYEPDQDPQEEDYIGQQDKGGSSYRNIPVYCLDFSNNMSIGFKLGPLAQEHYQMRSYENSATARACLTIPVVKLGPSIPAPAAPINPAQMKTNRGNDPRTQFNEKGYLVLGSEDAVEIVETQGSSLKFIHLQNEDRVETMHEAVSQLHSSSKQTSSKTGRSAAAMKESRYSMEVTLGEHAQLIYDLSKQVYQDLATSRKDSIIPVVEGLCTETPEDAETLLKRYLAMSKSAIGSKLFDKKYRFKLASALMGKTSREEQKEIMKQINEVVETGKPADLFGPGFDAELQQQINAKAAPDNAKEAGQDAGMSPSTSPTSGDKSSPSKASASPKMGPGGQSLLSDSAHLQTGQHVDPQMVYDQLAQDYKPKNIKWVLSIPWTGPVEIPLTSLDFSNSSNWKASQEPDKVDKFADLISNEGFAKPIIVVYQGHNNEKMIILDGHHRALAYQQNNQPVMAYVGHIGQLSAEMASMHSQQDGSSQQMASNQKSDDFIPEY